MLLRRSAVAVVLLAVLVVMGLTVYHWRSAKAGVAESVKMTVDDLQLVARCPTKLQNIRQFLARPSDLAQSYPEVAGRSMGEVISFACEK